MHRSPSLRLGGSKATADDAYTVVLIPQGMRDWGIGAGSHGRYVVGSGQGFLPSLRRLKNERRRVPSSSSWDYCYYI